MQTKTILLFGLAILACECIRRSDKGKSTWFHRLSGWQKLFGIVAFILALLIILNPEFLALGLLGDSAFFDLLVLLLSLQLQRYVRGSWHFLRDLFSRTTRWLSIPSPGTRYLMAASAIFFASVVSTVQKIVHRLSS